MQIEMAVVKEGSQTWVNLKADVTATAGGSYWRIDPPPGGWPASTFQLRVTVDDPSVARLRERLAQAVRYLQDAGDRRDSAACDEAEEEVEHLRAELAAAEAVQQGATPGMHIAPSGEVTVIVSASSQE